jgi:hypothetical protein
MLKLMVMKRVLYFFGLVLMVSALFQSCAKEDEFDEALLIGKWQTGTLHYKYLSNYSGASWDTKDSTEEQAQAFTWKLVKSDLEHKHVIEMGGFAYENYTIMELTATTMKWKDEYDNKIYTLTKVD